jgi:hypothetical protein
LVLLRRLVFAGKHFLIEDQRNWCYEAEGIGDFVSFRTSHEFNHLQTHAQPSISIHSAAQKR